MAITDYHRAIFNFLESYRSEHPEAKLTYSLRQKNTTDRPRNLYLFTGSEKYILVGLYAQHNGNTKTRSIGFGCDYKASTDTIKQCSLSIVYDDPKLYSQDAVYQEIIKQIGIEQFVEFSPKRFELIYKDPDWQTNLQTYLEYHRPIIDEVIRQAGVEETFYIPIEKLEASISVMDQALEPVANYENYTWVPFYQELCSKLVQYSPADLINYTKEVLEVQQLVGLKDKDAGGNPIELVDIDPYTFLSFINRGSDPKRLAVLARLREMLSIKTSTPTDLAGLYTDQNQWIWLFGYSYERQPDDVENLRKLFQLVDEKSGLSDLFNQVVKITRITPGKLSEALFTQKPDQYFPINNRTKTWLKKRNLPFLFKTLAQYRWILDAIRLYDQRPYYQISHEAFIEYNALQSDTNNMGTTYWVFQGNPDQFRIVDALRDSALQTWRVSAHAQRIKIGDKIILWVAGKESGCYALAEVASDVYSGTDETGEQYYQTGQQASTPGQRVKIKIVLNLWDRPVTKADVQDLPAFADFKGGSQGTNFTATAEQYQTILNMRQPVNRRFWKYSPGSQAARWPDDLKDQTMAISFSEYDTGPLNQYATQADLDSYLGKVGNRSNQTWNMILFKDAAIGDVVLANKGRDIVLGVGIITGLYQYQDKMPEYQHYRTVDWLADQAWQYTADQIPAYPNLFRVDTFSPTLIGPQIINKYISQYPQYRLLFEQHGLIESNQSKTLPTPERYAKNIILYGPPGTGKTYSTIDLAVDIVDGQKAADHKISKARFDQLRKDGQIEFVTFHQNYTYEDFVMGLKPDIEAGSLKFEQREGIFYRMAKRARNNYEADQTHSSTAGLKPFEEVFEEFIHLLESNGSITLNLKQYGSFTLTGYSNKSLFYKNTNGTINSLSKANIETAYHTGLANNFSSYILPIVDQLRLLSSKEITAKVKNYVLIIDEINRANMSRVFGELITLLEDDKRLGADNELTVTLPSGESFAVPPNLYLIGTMNTADKSLALLDIALRRRFEFIGKYPDYTVLDEPARTILERLNKVILIHKKSADFLIGHAYFMNKSDQPIKSVLDNRVIPLLLEYFNGRTDLVGTVLAEAGISFIKNELTFQIEATDA